MYRKGGSQTDPLNSVNLTAEGSIEFLVQQAINAGSELWRFSILCSSGPLLGPNDISTIAVEWNIQPEYP